MARLLFQGRVHTVTDDVAAARKDLSLITLDRALSLVTGGRASWLEPPEAPKAEEAASGGPVTTHDVDVDPKPEPKPEHVEPVQHAEHAERSEPVQHAEHAERSEPVQHADQPQHS